ncbi:MAG: phosphatidate cytidylyltransferase [Woeseiaceae bacterium]
MLKTRVITAVIALLALIVVLFFLPARVAEAVIALAVIAGAWEWSGFLGSKSTALRAGYVVLIAALLAAFAVPLAEQTLLLLQVALVWWLLAFLWTFFYPTPIPAAVRWICGVLVLLPLYVALIELYRLGSLWLLFLLLIVWAADMGAFFAGKTMGKVKLAPQISPGKTWEGAIGGLIAVALLILGRSFFVDSNLAILLPFCLAIGAISIVGDLTVSMFKRTAGIKDSGTLFPGHGGVLDRVDSIAAAAPLFVLGMHMLGGL